MTSLFPDRRGAVTLLFTVTLMVLSTMVIFFATRFAVTQDKLMANYNRNAQAYQAAEAGLEFGINYLKQNSSTILANPTNGHIQSFSNSSTTNVVLANGSQFSITYTNPVANNYTLISISSTGTSDDGSSTRVVSQLVGFGSLLANSPVIPLTSKGEVILGGSSQVRNLHTSTTIISGDDVTISGSASTVLSSGTSSTTGNIQADVQQANSTISNTSTSDFFAGYFGVSASTIKNNVNHYYSSNSSQNYSNTLNGLIGTSIWIDQLGGSANLSGNVTIGSSSSPVLMIVNGNLNITGNVVIYGFLYVMGQTTTDILGNVTVNGGVVTQSDLRLSGSVDIDYNPTILSNLRSQSSMSYYARVPGSWKDF